MPAPSIVSIRRRDPTIDKSAGETKYTLTYRVQLSAASGDIITALTGADPVSGLTLPNYGSYFQSSNDSDSYAKCYRIHGKQAGSRKTWDFVCEYSTKRYQPPNEPPNKATPWVRDAEWGPFEQLDYTNVVSKGKKATPTATETAIKNAAGQRYDPAPLRAFTNTLLRVRFYAQTVDLDKIESYRNTINSAAFWNFKARRLKINRYIGSPVYEYGQWFGVFDAEIEVNCDPATSNTWYLSILEEGTKVIRSGQLVLPRDGSNKDYYGTALLAADGTQLPKDGEPVFTAWYVEREAAFASAGLPAFPAHIVKVADA